MKSFSRHLRYRHDRLWSLARPKPFRQTEHDQLDQAHQNHQNRDDPETARMFEAIEPPFARIFQALSMPLISGVNPETSAGLDQI